MRRWQVAVFVGLLVVGWVLVLFGIGILVGRAMLPEPPPAPVPTSRPVMASADA